MRIVRSIVAGLFVLLNGSAAWAANCAGFTDVATSNQFCAAVTYIKDHGITLGCTGTTFCPDDYVTRLQMAAFLQRAGQADPSNVLGDHTTAIGGGTGNTSNATPGYSTVGGGLNNAASGYASTISGGYQNSTVGVYAAVAGGSNNLADGVGAFVGGGDSNTASGVDSTVPGGSGNQALGTYSVAAGANAVVTHNASFLWCDGHATCNSQEDRDFIVVASGGIKFYNADGNGGCVLTNPAGGGWACSSDRNLKEHFATLDGEQVLQRVAAMPVTRWNVKGVAGQDHIGPVAQDFYSAFGLGVDDLHIASGDLSGVALAAIQGLNAKVVARDAIISEQARELAELRARMDGLEHGVAHR